MRTLIVYSSKYGFTEKVANILADQIQGDVTTAFCDKQYTVDLTQYENVIVGSSIYAGQVNHALRDFCEKYKGLLECKRIGFFLTGGDPSPYIEIINKNFPESLVQRAEILSHFGYAYDFSKMSFIDRNIVKFIVKKRESEIIIHQDKILTFAQLFNRYAMENEEETGNGEKTHLIHTKS